MCIRDSRRGGPVRILSLHHGQVVGGDPVELEQLISLVRLEPTATAQRIQPLPLGAVHGGIGIQIHSLSVDGPGLALTMEA